MAGDNVNTPDKVEAQALKPGENSTLNNAVDFKTEQVPLAFKPENSDKKLPSNFQLDFGGTDIYSSGLGDFSNLGKKAQTLDLYPKGKPITFDVGETKVADANSSASAEAVVKPGDKSGTAAETVVKDGDQGAKSVDTGVKAVEFAPHKVVDGETYWSIAKDHLKETGGHDPSDREVMNYLKVLAKHNGLTLEQASHIDHNDVVKFPPEKQASVVNAEKASTSKEGSPDGNTEAVVGKEGSPDGNTEAVVGKEGNPDGNTEAVVGKEGSPDRKTEAVVGKGKPEAVQVDSQPAPKPEPQFQPTDFTV